MAAGHDEDDGEQAGQGEDVRPDPGPAQPAPTAFLERVEVEADPVRVDGGRDPVGEEADVEEQDEGEDPGLEDEPEELEAQAQCQAGEEREGQQGQRGEPDGPLPGARVRVAEPGEEEREERGGERRAAPRSRTLRSMHRG